MAWNTQSRTLEIVSNAIPEYFGKPVFEVVRCRGVEKLGTLSDYWIDVQTIEASGLESSTMADVVDISKILGQNLTLKIAIDGSGTLGEGEVNVGAGVREITGVIGEMLCLGSDDRRMYYRLRLRCFLWLASLNRENRHFRDMDVLQISHKILSQYKFNVNWDKVIGAFNGRRPYPKRDYQRQFWMSDWDYLNLLWQEWGLCFYWEGSTLVMIDNHGYPGQDEPYRTVRYIERGGQRVDEEHIHKLKYGRGLTTGQVVLMDYDYTMADVNGYARKMGQRSDTMNDNAEEYNWGDYAQPMQGGMGLNSERNDEEFEGDHLALVRSDAHRNKSLVIKGSGNLRGLKVGRQFTITGYPLRPVNRKYIVTGTKFEIVNNDSVTQSGDNGREYSCRMKFTGVPSGHYYRIPLKAKKPRAFAEKAIVTGCDKTPGVFTDAMGRVRAKFIWDRENQLDDEASCWIPPMQIWQGKQYGGIWTPRVGDHVYIGFVNMDPDRPFILGSHATDYNAVPWELYHNHALSGWRSLSLEGYDKGSNTVVTDDTPGELQVQVTSDHAHSRFIAGNIRNIDGDKGRTNARGEGVEVATEAHAVVRANKGVLLTSESRDGATAPVKDMGETVARLTQARQHHEELSQLAQKHNAQAPASSQADVTAAIKTQNDAIKGGQKTANDPSPEMTRPDIVVASAAGIATTATDSTHMASRHDHAITVGRDYSLSAGRSMYASVAGSISLFAYRDGMKFFSAKGPVQIEAQGGPMSIKALGNIEVTSSEGKITISAEQELVLAAGGSFIQINANGIVNGSPGPILEKGATWKKADAATMYPRLTTFVPHPFEYSCGEAIGLTTASEPAPSLSAVSEPPAPHARKEDRTSKAASGSAKATNTTSADTSASTRSTSGTASTASTTPIDRADSGAVGANCSWAGVDYKTDPKDEDVESGEYYYVDYLGNQVIDAATNTPKSVNYTGYQGKYQISYDKTTKIITLTARILLEPMEIVQTVDGVAKVVPHNHDVDWNSSDPTRVKRPREVSSIASFIAAAKAKIERTFNRNNYYLVDISCPRGNVCGAKVPVRFVIEFLTSDPDGKAHKKISLYEKSLRADAANWGEKSYNKTVNNVDIYYSYDKEQVHTHEVGHIFGFPDEYYWGMGAIHKTYIKSDKSLNYPLAKNNPNKEIWQGEARNTLMGGGCLRPEAETPPYYLAHVLKWFHEQNGSTWAVRGNVPTPNSN